MFDKNTPLSCPVHAAPDHPKVPEPKVGILIAIWEHPITMIIGLCVYLGEFLSDKRVIDYPAYLWQPLLQLIILTSRHSVRARPINQSGMKKRAKAP